MVYNRIDNNLFQVAKTVYHVYLVVFLWIFSLHKTTNDNNWIWIIFINYLLQQNVYSEL